MNALRISLVAVMCFGWLPSLADGTLSAAEHVIQAIPGDALGFVALNRLGATASELKATSERLQMPLPDLLGMLKSRLGVTEGLDETGSAALVALPRPQGGMPALLLYVPVTDYQKFLSALKPEDATAALVNVQVMNNAAVAANRPGFAVLTQPGDREILARAVGTKQSVAGQLPGLVPWCEQQQMAVWVTRPGVRTLCTAGKQGLQVAQQAVEASFKQAGKGDQLAAVSAGLDVYRSLFEAAEKVVTNVALGLRWDDEGTLFVTKQVHVDPGSKIAAALGKLAPASSSPMVGLPAGRYLVAAGMQIPEEMTETMIDLSAALMKSTPRLYGLDEHSVDALMESGRPMMKQLRGMSFELGVAEPGEPLYSRMYATMKVDDADKYLLAYDDYVAEFAKLTKDSKAMFAMSLEKSEVKIDGQPALLLSFTIPMPLEEGKEAEQVRQMMAKMFGPDGKMRAYLAAAGKDTVAMAYTKPEALRDVLAVVKGTNPDLAQDSAVKKTAALLPGGSPGVGFWSLPGTMDFVNQMIAANGPSPAKISLPPFPDAPPMGFAVQGKPGMVEWTMVVPAELVQKAVLYAGQVQQAMSAQGPGRP